MIIIRLEGGLGNQMFQYAFGKALSLEKKCELLFDISSFENGVGDFYENGLSRRNFELNIFTLNLQTWNNNFCNFFPTTLIERITLKLEKLLGLKSIIFENKYGFDETLIARIKKHTYFIGYWQSSLYFDKYRNGLINDFHFKLPEFRNLLLEDKIQNTNSVSIHVRRGDYVNSVDANKVHGLCSIEYYKKATSIIIEQSDNVQWFVFSDDIEWCKENFNWLYEAFFVTSNKSEAYYDMYLMSICRHNIIANSTFSWWGAWLNQNISKIVVGPSKWFADIEKNDQINGILPSSWISI